MRKMGYTILFLVVLIALVFAGCVRFAKDLPGNTGASEGQSETDPDYSAEASEMEAMLAAVTDEAGVTVYTPEQVSVIVQQEIEAESQAAATAAGTPATTAAPVDTPAAQPSAAASTPGTTAKNDGSAAPTAAAPTTAAPAPATTAGQTPVTQTPAPTGVNEYDILRSGKFYAVGTMTDSQGTNPMEIALTDNSIFMAANMEGVQMALLQSNKKIYMIYPAKKIYMEVNAAVQAMVGMNADEMLNVEELGFSEMAPLTQADTVADGELNGTKCKIYTFNKESGSRTVIYMNGNKLLALETVSGNSRSVNYFTTVSATVPADKSAPPADYTKVGIFKFMTEMGDVLQ